VDARWWPLRGIASEHTGRALPLHPQRWSNSDGDAVRPIRDDIERRVRALLGELGVDVQVSAHDD
jgi:hypothetical protein